MCRHDLCSRPPPISPDRIDREAIEAEEEDYHPEEVSEFIDVVTNHLFIVLVDLVSGPPEDAPQAMGVSSPSPGPPLRLSAVRPYSAPPPPRSPASPLRHWRCAHDARSQAI